MSASWWERRLSGDAPRPVDRVELPSQPRTPSNPERVTVDNLYDAAVTWRGGESQRDPNCPACGSNLYFTRSNAAPVVTQQGVARVPGRCYACGHVDGRPMQGSPA